MKHNKWQLSYEANLRGYASKTPFRADRPFLFPAPRSFKPAEALKNFAKDGKLTHYDVRNKFTDRLTEANSNLVNHTLDTNTTVFINAEWMATLRNDRQERKALAKSLR